MSTFNLADVFEITAAAVPERTAVVAGAVRREPDLAWAAATASGAER